MLLLLFFLELAFFFLSNVAALSITVQSDTIVGQPSLVVWSRELSDGNGQLVFDLRFVKPDGTDVGLAVSNVQAPPSTVYGTLQVVFPSPGAYLLVAVSGADLTKLGQSGQVNAFQVPTSFIPTSTSSQPVPSSTSSAKPTFTPAASGPSSVAIRRKKNIGAIVGGTLGGVAFLGLLAALVIFFLRRRQSTDKKTRRWTFHRDKMVLPPVLDIRQVSPIFDSGDIERQQQGQEQELPHDDNNLSTSPVVMIASPTGRRPLIKSLNRPLPLPPLPLKPEQKEIVDQMEQIRKQVTELEKDPGPTQHIILDDLQKQKNWLRSQMKKITS